MRCLAVAGGGRQCTAVASFIAREPRKVCKRFFTLLLLLLFLLVALVLVVVSVVVVVLVVLVAFVRWVSTYLCARALFLAVFLSPSRYRFFLQDRQWQKKSFSGRSDCRWAGDERVNPEVGKRKADGDGETAAVTWQCSCIMWHAVCIKNDIATRAAHLQLCAVRRRLQSLTAAWQL